MKKFLFLLCIISSIQLTNAQCPEGPRPTFWHPNQIDSFRILYPTCDNYDFQTTIIDGKYVKPKLGTMNDKLYYGITLIAILALIIFLLKIVIRKFVYFRK